MASVMSNTRKGEGRAAVEAALNTAGTALSATDLAESGAFGRLFDTIGVVFRRQR